MARKTQRLGPGTRRRGCRLALLAALLVAAPAARAVEALAAVAANFAAAMTQLEAAFEAGTGHRLTVVPGATGQLSAQIRQGAPFDVLLAADVEHPRRLAQAGFGVPGTRFVYAVGRLVLWSPDPAAFDDGPAYLRRGAFRHLAIANPKLAPYGAAARQALTRLGVDSELEGRIVLGQDVGQVHALTATRAADAGFVALSALHAGVAAGSSWTVPAALHAPIEQEAILLTHGRDNPAAAALLDYLRTPAARELIRRLGYDLPAS